MRLAEGVGLLWSDFIEQDGVRCVNYQASSLAIPEDSKQC